MILWVPEGGALAASLKPGCLQSLRDKPASHDNLFHTTMGWVGARADVYKPEWDLLAGCRNETAADCTPAGADTPACVPR